jgi:hypothetical protein
VDALVRQCEMTCPSVRNDSCDTWSYSMPTYSPTPLPTLAVEYDINIEATIVLKGLSRSTWNLNKESYDSVFVTAVVDTIGNPSITPATVSVKEVYDVVQRWRQRRRLDDGNGGKTGVPMTIIAPHTRGSDAKSILKLLQLAVDDGSFTITLQQDADEMDVSGFEVVEAESFSGSEVTSDNNSNKKSSSMSAANIGTIVVGTLIAALFFVYWYAFRPKDDEDEDHNKETGDGEEDDEEGDIKMENLRATSNPLHAKTLADDVIPTANANPRATATIGSSVIAPNSRSSNKKNSAGDTLPPDVQAKFRSREIDAAENNFGTL